MQRDEALEIVGKLGAMLGFAAAEGVACEIVRVAAGGRRLRRAAPNHLAVVGDAADGGAAEVDAVIAALAADQARPWKPLPLARW